MIELIGPELESIIVLALLILTGSAAILLCLVMSPYSPELDAAPSDAQFQAGRLF